MKISTKGRYALRVMLDLAQHRDEGPIPLKDIAKRQDISKTYLEQIMIQLNKSDILKTTRGNKGGYRLVRPPDQYTVGEILRATEGNIGPVDCINPSAEGCERSESCMSQVVWRELDEVIRDYMDNKTLQDILDQFQERGKNNYVI